MCGVFGTDMPLISWHYTLGLAGLCAVPKIVYCNSYPKIIARSRAHCSMAANVDGPNHILRSCLSFLLRS